MPACRFPRCSEDQDGAPFCEEHWGALPEDLQLRIRWAYDEGNSTDRRAAIAAGVEYLRED